MSNKILHIEVPETFRDNFGDPINHILKILPKLNKDWETIVVDFGKNKFLVPHYLGPLSCILEEKRKRGIEIKVINETTYAQTVHFENGFFQPPFSEENISFEAYKHKTFIPVIHFPTSKLAQDSKFRDNLLSAVNQILKKQLKLPINILSAIYYMLDELTQNIVDHSEISFGTIFGQFYPGKKYLDLNICDSGNGLYKSYINSGKHNPISNKEAINFGVYGKSTKNIPESRGFGLNTSRNMLTKGMGGQFFLMTGNGFFIQNSNIEEIITLDDQMAFNGCMLNLRIPLIDAKDFDIHKYTSL
jgi:hypothetical protein